MFIYNFKQKHREDQRNAEKSLVWRSAVLFLEQDTKTGEMFRDVLTNYRCDHTRTIQSLYDYYSMVQVNNIFFVIVSQQFIFDAILVLLFHSHSSNDISLKSAVQ